MLTVIYVYGMSVVLLRAALSDMLPDSIMLIVRCCIAGHKSTYWRVFQNKDAVAGTTMVEGVGRLRGFKLVSQAE